MQHLNRVLLPSRDAIIDCIKLLRQLIFPGYFGKQGLTTQNVPFRIGELVIELSDRLYEQVRCCLRYRQQIPGLAGRRASNATNATPRRLESSSKFLDRDPRRARHMLATDVQAAFDGDPAAQSTDETIFCYPGLFAIFVQRMAHEFYKLDVPLLPRIMTEYAHSLTGIDIHPGAKLGRSFFIDHGTGVVDRRDHRDRRQRQDLPGRHARRPGSPVRPSPARPEAASDDRRRRDDLCRGDHPRRRHRHRPRGGDRRQRVHHLQRSRR